MARITVEDCIDKVEGPYDLVLIAKERAVQLNSGAKPKVEHEKDKNTVIALKEIAENKVSVKEIEESAIQKLRKHIEQDTSVLEHNEPEGDDFENIYKGEISKSGISILPSKRVRKIPEKIEIFKVNKTSTQEKILEEKSLSEKNEASLKELEDQKKTEEELNKIKNPDTSDIT